MTLFPLWLLNVLVIGSLFLCSAGVALLIVFLVTDTKQKRIW